MGEAWDVVPCSADERIAPEPLITSSSNEKRRSSAWDAKARSGAAQKGAFSESGSYFGIICQQMITKGIKELNKKRQRGCSRGE